MNSTAFNRQQRILLGLACSDIFFEVFDVSIVNLALPLIAADLRVSLATARWVPDQLVPGCLGRPDDRRRIAGLLRGCRYPLSGRIGHCLEKIVLLPPDLK